MSGLDQEIPITETELKVFDTVDTIVDKAVTSGDPVPAFEFAKELIRSGQIRGLALAKLFYEMKSKWSLFQAAGADDNFEDYAFAHSGRAPETVLKYTRMWENIFANKGISDGIKRRLMGRSIEDLLLLTAVAREGTDRMEELAEAPDTASLKEMIREERGERTSSGSALRLFLQLKDAARFPRGALYLNRQTGPEVFGSLDVDSEDEGIQKAIARVVNAAGIKEMS